MSKTKTSKPLIIAVVGVVLAAICLITVLFFTINKIIDGKIYPRNAAVLNLRDQQITVEHYEAVKKELPDCDIYWNLPFQGGYYSEDTTQLTISSITDEDIELLGYLEDLQIVHAEDCEDYAQLAALQKAYPQCRVIYTVTIDGAEYYQDAQKVTVNHLTDEEVVLLDYLPQLTEVDASGCEDYAQLAALQQRRPECAVSYSVTIGTESVQVDTTELTLLNQSLAELAELMPYFTRVETVELLNPQGTAAEMTALYEAYPDVTFECQLSGVGLSEDGKEVDLSGITLTSVEQIGEYMTFYPHMEQVFLGVNDLDNDELAAYRETMRSDFKVVWTVMCGEIPTRTDATTFQPVREGVYYFFDDEAYYLRYCEDLIVVDVGHMALHDISWVEYLPNLQYLILAHTTVLDISPLATCKNLIWLELDYTGITDYTPLLGCTSLQDLNLGLLWGDATPISQMTWLKNLWWMDCSYAKQTLLRETLTETNMNFNPGYTCGGGWRKLPNYYAMRDLLGMPYMD